MRYIDRIDALPVRINGVDLLANVEITESGRHCTRLYTEDDVTDLRDEVNFDELRDAIGGM